jgi:hypothetical protein
MIRLELGAVHDRYFRARSRGPRIQHALNNALEPRLSL